MCVCALHIKTDACIQLQGAYLKHGFLLWHHVNFAFHVANTLRYSSQALQVLPCNVTLLPFGSASAFPRSQPQCYRNIPGCFLIAWGVPEILQSAHLMIRKGKKLNSVSLFHDENKTRLLQKCVLYQVMAMFMRRSSDRSTYDIKIPRERFQNMRNRLSLAVLWCQTLIRLRGTFWNEKLLKSQSLGLWFRCLINPRACAVLTQYTDTAIIQVWTRFRVTSVYLVFIHCSLLALCLWTICAFNTLLRQKDNRNTTDVTLHEQRCSN